MYKLGNFSFGDYRVVQIQPTILPLDWTVDIYGITQPIIGRSSAILQYTLTNCQLRTGTAFLLYLTL